VVLARDADVRSIPVGCRERERAGNYFYRHSNVDKRMCPVNPFLEVTALLGCRFLPRGVPERLLAS
jgi:hypothetical protein